LVVDSSSSMALWYSIIAEWKLLLERQGAFRDVRVWSMVWDDSQHDNDKQKLHLRPGLYSKGFSYQQELHNMRELLDPTGRRLVLIMSDCVSRIWRDGTINKALTTWGGKGPLAIIQLLPRHLWERSALGDATEIYMHTIQSGIPNACYRRETA